jgi:hypothetical protein
MQPTDTPCSTATAGNFSAAASEDSLSLPSSPSPHTAAAAPPHSPTPPAASGPTGRQPKSGVWNHFRKNADYRTSKKATCAHCGKTLVASRGSTTTMNNHVKNRHPQALAASAGTESLDR